MIDVEDLIKTNDTANLNEVSDEIRALYEWIALYEADAEYRKQLPAQTQQSIDQEFKTVVDSFSRINSVRSTDLASFGNQKQYFVQRIRKSYDNLYNNFIRDYRTWQLLHSQEQKSQELELQLNMAKSKQEATAKELSSILSAARRSQKTVAKLQRATAEATQDIGLSTLAKHFSQLYEGDVDDLAADDAGSRRWLRRRLSSIKKFFSGYRGAARMWFIISILLFGVTFWAVSRQLLPYIDSLATLSSEGAEIRASVIYATLVVKALVLLVPVYAIRFCLKNYGANKHLAADALHKAKTLQTLQTYLAITKDNASATGEVAVTVAKLVFAPADSGFANLKIDGEKSDLTINAPIRAN